MMFKLQAQGYSKTFFYDITLAYLIHPHYIGYYRDITGFEICERMKLIAKGQKTKKTYMRMQLYRAHNKD
jgi:hypothetical protein